jgi:hypothetical protein
MADDHQAPEEIFISEQCRKQRSEKVYTLPRLEEDDRASSAGG